MIEPAYMAKTVDYYKNKNIYPTIFYEMDDARQFWTNEVMKNPLWLYRDFSNKRMHQYAIRIPILTKGEIAADIYSVAFIGKDGATNIGYAPIRTDKSPTGYQLFDFVLFFSQNELEELIQQLHKIYSMEIVSDAKAFQDAIVKIGQAMLGQFNEDEIRNMDMDKLLGQIYGIPVPLNLCGLDIKKIPNMDEEDLKDYINEFKAKLEKIKRINSDAFYDGRFQKNRITYYWIPMEDMPGVYEDCNQLKMNR